MRSRASNAGKGSRSRRQFSFCCALVGAVLGMVSTRAPAQIQCAEQQKLTASDANMGDNFGSSVSVNGSVTVVGAGSADCATGTNCGAAYLYRYNGSSWLEEQKLFASDANPSALFGLSVAVSGDTAIVGAPGEACPAGSNCGAAYLFRFNGIFWVEEKKLTASDAASGDQFGLSVSISENTAVVGAHAKRCSVGVGCGAAYVFQFDGTTWVEKQKLTPSDTAPGNQFGISLSVSGDAILLGARYDDCAAGDHCGSAYVFRFDGDAWVEAQKLTASDAAADDWFGRSVSINGNAAVVGASRVDCAAGDHCGAAYAFRFDGTAWMEERKLMASDAAAFDSFGGSVAISGNRIVAGARFDDCAEGLSCGAAYVYHFNGSDWFEQQKLTASDAAAIDVFGWSVSISGNTAVVAADNDDCSAGSRCGSVYSFHIPDSIPLAPDPNRVESSRYISFVPHNAGELTAFQVTLVNPLGFPEWDATTRWVGPPKNFPENDAGETNQTFVGAALQCDPEFNDWGTVTLLHVFGAEIMPDSSYEIRAITPTSGPLDDPTNYSCALTVTTGKWGDAVEPFYGAQATVQPDFRDIRAVVAKFLGESNAPDKVSTQLRPNVVFPGHEVDFKDISAEVSAFLGVAYADDVAIVGPCTCPSLVTCGATPCSANSHCQGRLCVNGSCMDACGRCSP